MNRVLRSFMYDRRQASSRGRTRANDFLQPDRMVKVGEDRPDWGSTQQMEAEIKEKVAGLRREREAWERE